MINNNRKLLNDKGFTLVEVLASVLLLALVALLVLPMIARTTGWIGDSNDDVTMSHTLPTLANDLKVYSDTYLPAQDSLAPFTLDTTDLDLAGVPASVSDRFDFKIEFTYDPYVSTFPVYVAHIEAYRKDAKLQGPPTIETYTYVEARGNLDE